MTIEAKIIEYLGKSGDNARGIAKGIREALFPVQNALRRMLDDGSIDCDADTGAYYVTDEYRK